MTDSLDQIFVFVKHWLLDQLANVLPPAIMPLVSSVMSLLPVLVVFPSLFALTTVFERKGLGRIQNRYGPNRVGPFGFLQFAADGIKAIIKEDVVPRAADKVVHFIAPVILVITALTVYAVLPFGRNMVAADFDAGLLFFFAVGAASELAVFMAGWSSRNKYALLGAMRAVAQMVSYEIPLILSSVAVVMITGTLSLPKIVAAQSTHAGLLPDWFVFTPWGFAGFILFLIAANAELNRSPFDLPEGESEIIAGYFIEYSGFKFALFFLAEYLSMFALSGLGITLFLGGWNAPFAALEFIPSWAWFFIKLLTMIFMFIWTRGTLPRLRQDQLMNLAWKFMIPMVLVNLVAAAVWHFTGPGITRWFTSGALVLGAYMLLGKPQFESKDIGKRTYRFAD
ncbi:MAG: NADH-quinone oxidoreductase subunit NuoH [Verrucomicrobia bacterium]|nr:NADH-quinone oxidoreductase subunit NuoH [Verrucomicrobiota bacterium]